jgi:hypothetical protein
LVHRKYTQETPKANPQQLTENKKRTQNPRKNAQSNPQKSPTRHEQKPKDPRDNPQPTKAHNPTTCRPFLYYA